MVRGVEIFREYFRDYGGQYVFIGGTACELILGKLGTDFRATKDLDIVLLVEALNKDFISAFLSFIEDGGYEHIHKGTGKNQFFRFSDPQDKRFPVMIELFSRRPDYLSSKINRLGAIHISEDVISLSAILLDDEYYELLKQGIVVHDEISILNLEHIILFKMKAWLDLLERKSAGERIDGKDIKKHRNDIFRLAGNIERETRIVIEGQVKADAMEFLEKVKADSVELKDLGIKNTSYEELLDRLRTCYNIK